MGIYFEKISKYADDESLPLPKRGTALSAGYDFVVAEDVVIPPIDFLIDKIRENGHETKRHKDYYGFIKPYTLDELAAITKELKARPTLVPTGIKCHMEPGQCLKLSMRSSSPLKYFLVLANPEGLIEPDYYNNQDNEGHIFFQIFNLGPFAIELKKGDVIGQGRLTNYLLTDDDSAEGERKGGFGSTDE